MEFNQKIQQLRKQKGLTQEELGEKLFVTRTAISKWESGRGYPNIDSLKAMARLFDVTVDELLSCEELLVVAEHDNKRKENTIRDLVFGLLDLSIVLLLFLPFFAQKVDGVILEVSLLNFTKAQTYLIVIYYAIVVLSVVTGVSTLLLRKFSFGLWVANKRKLSLFISVVAVVVFSVSLQPYATVLAFVFLIIKSLTLVKI